MENTIIGAMSTLFSLQRWNFLPRVETWVEAENVAFVTHVGYGIGRDRGMNPDLLQHFLARSILKSFNKHFLSDIPILTRDTLKEYDADLWLRIVNKAAEKTSQLFPKKISSAVRKYLTHSGDYSVQGQEDQRDKQKESIENLLKYVQYKIALDECETNRTIYNMSDYEEIMKDIQKKIELLPEHEVLESSFQKHRRYLLKIKGLKYLRRWNMINRSIESSVMSHTFLVTFFK